MSLCLVWAAIRWSGTPASTAAVAWPARMEWAVIWVPSSPAASVGHEAFVPRRVR